MKLHIILVLTFVIFTVVNSFCTLNKVNAAFYIDIEPTSWNMANIQKSTLKQFSDEPNFLSNSAHFFSFLNDAPARLSLLNDDTLPSFIKFNLPLLQKNKVKFSSDNRSAYIVSSSGWLSKYDLITFKKVAMVRTGLEASSLALSSDGNYVLVGHALPQQLVFLNAQTLKAVKIIPTIDRSGKSSKVSHVYNAPLRYSFIISFKDATEVWEIPYSDKGGVEVYKGWAHDYRKDGGEGKVENWKVEEQFPIRRIETDGFITDFFFDPDYINLIGTARNSHNRHVINLDIKKKVASLVLTSTGNLRAGITWDYQGKEVFVSPNFKGNKVTVIDMDNWQELKEIKTEGSGFFIRSHNNSRYAWLGVFFSPNKVKIHIIEKSTLKIVKTIVPSLKTIAAHVAFTKDGKYVLLRVWDKDGELITYDANTLEIVKRMPMKKTSGKYNVYNKTHYERSTSH